MVNAPVVPVYGITSGALSRQLVAVAGALQVSKRMAHACNYTRLGMFLFAPTSLKRDLIEPSCPSGFSKVWVL